MNCKNCTKELSNDLRFVCPNCGRTVCEDCSSKTLNICPDCYHDLEMK